MKSTHCRLVGHWHIHWVRCALSPSLAILLAGAPLRATFAAQHALTPGEAAKSFRVADGFKVEQIAAEPHVVDPVSMAFDEDGRIYVAEMLDYPFIRTPGMFGPFPEGQIRLLEDTDGDGLVDKSTIFATAFFQPCSVLPYDGGVLVCSAPDIWFLKDTDGDGRADVRQKVLTGFDTREDLYRVNSLNWGIDGWIYVRGVGNTPVHWGDDPNGAELSTEGGDFRFKPREKKFEALSGMSSCFGETLDDFGRRFISNSAEHIHQLLLPKKYLKRNPNLVSPSVRASISDHENIARIFRVSPPQDWRVERSASWERDDLLKKYFGTIEPRADYMTAVTGPTIYRESLFPAEFHGNYFVCEAVGNLVHRDILRGDGPAFTASRAYVGREFLASTDPWFCPVFTLAGPDGALYVCDMYRQMIEHPGPDGGRSVPNVPYEIMQKYGIRAGSTMGRIYRVSPIGAAPLKRPRLSTASSHELATHLGNSNAWWRTTAQRLILQRPEQADIAGIEAVAQRNAHAAARVQALWTLDALGKLRTELALISLGDADPGARENAVQLAELHLPEPRLEAVLLKMTNDASPSVRFQLAFTMGELKAPGRFSALADIARRDAGDKFVRAAVLSSITGHEVELFQELSSQLLSAELRMEKFWRDLAQVIGIRKMADEIATAIEAVHRWPEQVKATAGVSVLDGLADGLKLSGGRILAAPLAARQLQALANAAPSAVQVSARNLSFYLRSAAQLDTAIISELSGEARDSSKPEADRVAIIERLAAVSWDNVAATVTALLDGRQPETIQIAALSALAANNPTNTTSLLVRRWKELTAGAQRQALRMVSNHKERVSEIIAAVRNGELPLDEVVRRQCWFWMMRFPDAQIAAQARALLEPVRVETDTARFDQLKGALALPADATRAKAIFTERCLNCHRAGGEGFAVGPDLTSVKGHTREQILANILYPSQSILPNFVAHIIETTDGELLDGIVVSATDNSVTLRRARAEETTVLRKNIKSDTTAKASLMPEGLLEGLSQQQTADLIEFVKQIN